MGSNQALGTCPLISVANIQPASGAVGTVDSTGVPREKVVAIINRIVDSTIFSVVIFKSAQSYYQVKIKLNLTLSVLNSRLSQQCASFRKL